MALKELYEALTGKTDFLKKVAGACFVAAKAEANCKGCWIFIKCMG